MKQKNIDKVNKIVSSLIEQKKYTRAWLVLFDMTFLTWEQELYEKTVAIGVNRLRTIPEAAEMEIPLHKQWCIDSDNLIH